MAIEGKAEEQCAAKGDGFSLGCHTRICGDGDVIVGVLGVRGPLVKLW